MFSVGGVEVASVFTRGVMMVLCAFRMRHRASVQTAKRVVDQCRAVGGSRKAVDGGGRERSGSTSSAEEVELLVVVLVEQIHHLLLLLLQLLRLREHG